MMWLASWCVVMMVFSVSADAAAGPNGLVPYDWREVDEDTFAAAPLEAGREAGVGSWVYLFGEEPRDIQRVMEQRGGRARPKRKMPSLSISNPMEVLRQRLLLEVARKQMREASQRQAVVNRVFLQNVGKRGFWADSLPLHYDE